MSSRLINLSLVAVLLLTFRPVTARGDEKKAVSQRAAEANAKALAKLVLTDITGRKHQPWADKSTKAVALIFVSKDCPVANAFQPSLREFEKRYGKKGIRCFMVYCSPRLKKSDVAKHVREYRIAAPAVMDPSQRIGRLTGAKVTPEAIVIDQTGKVRYRGMINNLYAGYGKKRPKPTKHYLRDACEAVIAGKAVTHPATKPIGCFIHYESKPQ